MVHDDLVSLDGAMLTLESSRETNGSQQKTLSEDHEVTLLLKPVPEHTLEQDQHQILGPHSEVLFDAPPEDHPAAEPEADMEGMETAPEPRPLTSTGCCTSTARPQCSTRLAPHIFMDCSKRKHFWDELMVEVLDGANEQVQYWKQRDL
ncbi:unnamed protein product [Caretta caretta]